MIATSCLLTCALLTGQFVGRAGQLPAPHLVAGQELVYDGTYAEEILGEAVRFNRAHRLEIRVLVLDSSPRGLDVALFTVLRPDRRRAAGKRGMPSEPTAVRLELAQVNGTGHVEAPSGVSLTAPLEGPATVECGAFVELPGTPQGVSGSWDVPEAGRPPRKWRVQGPEVVEGAPCIKLVGVQQSDDWDHPRADRVAWRRQDTVWLSARLGVAARLERIVERREPARREPGQRSIVRYTLASALAYPAPLFEECRREILRARTLAEGAEPYLADPGRSGRRALEATLTKINSYVENQPPTPYREAVLQIKRRVEAALRGEILPVAAAVPEATRRTLASVGEPAPDFLVPDMVAGGSARLRQFLGRPLLLVFYSPKARSAGELLRFAQDLHRQYDGIVHVVGLAVGSDRQQVLQQRSDLRMELPILSGNGLRITYGVDTTPKIVVLDADGIVRASYAGWGNETADEVTRELKACLTSRQRR